MSIQRIGRCAALTLMLILCLSWTLVLAEGASERGGLGNLGLTPEQLADLEHQVSGIEWIKDIQPDRVQNGSVKDWTFMVYLCGSDLGSSAKADMVEMAKSGFNEDEFNVVVYTGGSMDWGTEKIPVNQNGLFEVHNDMIKQVNEYLPDDMSMNATLMHFMKVATEKYPAEKFGLILWDHGGGPIFGICKDVLHGSDTMAIQALKTALENSPFAKKKLDFIGFDACLMASLEVGKTLQPFSKYMLASEESEPAFGWNYTFLGQIKGDTEVGEIGRKVVDTYFDFSEEAGGGMFTDVTMSCMDLQKMNDLEKACSTFFDEASQALDGSTYKYFAMARDKAVTFGDSRMDLIDLGSFVNNLKEGVVESQQKLLDSIDDLVVYNRSIREEAKGMSVYHPYNSAYMEKYSDVALSQEYSKYIQDFNECQTGGVQVDYSGISSLGSLIKGAVRDATSNFSLALTPEQMDFLAEAELLVLESEDGGETYAMVTMNPDVIAGADNTLTASYVHRALYITRGEGEAVEALSEPLSYELIGDKLYAINATLVGRDGAGNEVRRPVRLEFTFVDDDDTLEFTQIWALEQDGTYTIRHNIALSDYDSIEFNYVTRRPAAFEDGAVMGFDQWEIATAEPCSMPLHEDCELRMLHDRLDRSRIYVAFALRDLQNRRYTSTLVPLEEPIPDAAVLGYDNDYLDLVVPMPTLVTDGDRQGIRLNIRVTNNSEVADAIFSVQNVRVNGQSCDATTEIYGTGDNDGLTIGEEQVGTLFIPAEVLQGMGTLTGIDFDITILDAANGDAEAHLIPVEGHLELDVSAFN